MFKKNKKKSEFFLPSLWMAFISPTDYFDKCVKKSKILKNNNNKNKEYCWHIFFGIQLKKNTCQQQLNVVNKYNLVPFNVLEKY